MTEHKNFGMVNSLSASHSDDGEHAKITLSGQSAAGEVVELDLTEGAGRALWSHVTQILYPRAADQLTQRIMTAVTRPEGDRDTTHMVQAEADHDDPDTIQIAGIARNLTWMIKIDHDTGHDLWVKLEDIFDNV